MIDAFGYAAPLADCAYDFRFDSAYLSYADQQGKPAAYRDHLQKGQPAPIYFWFRQSPEPLIVNSSFSSVSPDDPPPFVSGMVELNLDPQGRLLQFDAVPPQRDEHSSGPAPFDWKPLFTAAGLDLTRFAPTEPQWLSLAPFDARAAWTGSYPNAPDIPPCRSRFLAHETGVLSADWSLDKTRTHAAFRGQVLGGAGVRGGASYCACTGYFSGLTQFPGQTW